jgi:hypothetical protein
MENDLSIAETILITVDSPFRYPDGEWDALAARLSSRSGRSVFLLHSHVQNDRSDYSWSVLWETLQKRQCKRLVWIAIGSQSGWWESIRDGVVWLREDAKSSNAAERLELYIASPLDARDWCEFLVEASKLGRGMSWLFLTDTPRSIDPINEDRPGELNHGMRAKRGEIAELVWEFRRRGLCTDFAFQSKAESAATDSVQPVATPLPLPRMEVPWGLFQMENSRPGVDSITQVVRREREATYRMGVDTIFALEAMDSILIGKWLGALQHGHCVWRIGGRERDREFESLQHHIQQTLPAEYSNSREPVSPRSMGSAKLSSDEFGQVAWGEIWTSFCDLAIAGGPPHRGRLLEAVDRTQVEMDLDRYHLVVREIRRGIEEASGLKTLESEAVGWVGIECEDEDMAAWMLRAIIAENVMVRREGRNLFVPAGPQFAVKREIKNVITTLAKTVRYWRAR